MILEPPIMSISFSSRPKTGSLKVAVKGIGAVLVRGAATEDNTTDDLVVSMVMMIEDVTAVLPNVSVAVAVIVCGLSESKGDESCHSPAVSVFTIPIETLSIKTSTEEFSSAVPKISGVTLFVNNPSKDGSKEMLVPVSIVNVIEIESVFPNVSVAVAVIVWRPSERSEEVIDQIPDVAVVVPIDEPSTKTSTEEPISAVPEKSGALSAMISPFVWESMVTVIEVSIVSVIGDGDAVFPNVSVAVAVIVWRPSERSEEVIDQIPDVAVVVPIDEPSTKTSTEEPISAVPKIIGVSSLVVESSSEGSKEMLVAVSIITVIESATGVEIPLELIASTSIARIIWGPSSNEVLVINQFSSPSAVVVPRKTPSISTSISCPVWAVPKILGVVSVVTKLSKGEVMITGSGQSAQVNDVVRGSR